MKDIFTDLYNKVLGFFKQTEKKNDESSKEVACNRLKFVLMQDRTNLTPELMDRMRKELIELLSKYVEMDKEALELGFEQEGSQMALMLSIPVLRAREEAEIEATLAEEDAKKAKEEADEEKDSEGEEGESDDSETQTETEDETEEVEVEAEIEITEEPQGQEEDSENNNSSGEENKSSSSSKKTKTAKK